MTRLLPLICTLSVVVSVYVFSFTYSYLSRMKIPNKTQMSHFPKIRQKRDMANITEQAPISKSLPILTVNRCCSGAFELNEQQECAVPRIQYKNKLEDHLTKGYYAIDDQLIPIPISSFQLHVKDVELSCPVEERSMINWDEDQPNEYFLSENKLVKLSDDMKSIDITFSEDNYCTDIMSGKVVSLLCPCAYGICIPKCCQIGYYYDLIKNLCIEETYDIPSYEPSFFTVQQEIVPNMSYFLINPGYPKCSKPKKLINNNLYLQEDGMLMLDKKAKSQFHFYNQYCVDTFFNGNTSIANGFYCNQEADIILSYKGYNKTNSVFLLLEHTDKPEESDDDEEEEGEIAIQKVVENEEYSMRSSQDRTNNFIIIIALMLMSEILMM